MTTTQRVAWQRDFGFEDQLEVQEQAVPTPGAGEARIRVVAAGLNPVDWKVTASAEAAHAFGVAVPGGYGNDFAGVVDEVGDGVDRWQVGDRVYGSARGHAVADYTVVAQDELASVPEGLSLTDAATLPIAARTAAAAIEPLSLTPDDTVLVGGAAGGVGVFAVQLATATGATVVATASPQNHEFLAALGATPVDYHGDLAANVRAAGAGSLTAASDLVGAATAQAALELGVPADRITVVGTGAAGVPDGVAVIGGIDARPAVVAEIADAVASGAIRVEIDETYPIDRVADAVAKLRDGHVRGKVVIVLDESLAA